ncbi:uncharacterized protein V1518DRAFT_367103, partial [Limtongia smithiae]|uniref:uncharacterized protein n=1 Tax=Limtongia smithiae TaxID=1125753 RepID=UPI0034CE4F11
AVTTYSYVHHTTSNPLLCDSPLGGRSLYADGRVTRSSSLTPVVPETIAEKEARPRRKFKFDYRELAIGSFVGIFVGFILGKLSKVVVFVGSSTFLFIQFLESRGLISIRYNSLYRWARRRYGNKELILENISFKVAFASAAMVAA